MLYKKIYIFLFLIFNSTLIVSMDTDPIREDENISPLPRFEELCNLQWKITPRDVLIVNNTKKKVIFDHEGTAVIFNDQFLINVYDIKTKRIIKTFNSRQIINNFILTDNNQYLIVSNEHTIEIFDYATCHIIKRLEFPGFKIQKIICTPNNEKIIISSSKFLKIIAFDTGEEILNLKHSKDITTITYSKDSKYILSNSMRQTIISNLETLEIQTLDNVSWGMFYYQNNQNNETEYLILKSDDNKICLYNLQEKKYSHVFEGHKGYIHLIAISPNNRYMASIAFDTTIKLWDITNKIEIGCIKGFVNPIKFLKFIDDRYFITISNENLVEIWDIKENKSVKNFNNFNFGDKTIINPNNEFIVTYSPKKELSMIELFRFSTLTRSQRNLFRSIKHTARRLSRSPSPLLDSSHASIASSPIPSSSPRPFSRASMSPSPKVDDILNALSPLKQEIFKQLNSDTKHRIQQTECSICCEKIDPFQLTLITQCEHIFHKECITQWAKTCKTELTPITCPICKTKIRII